MWTPAETFFTRGTSLTSKNYTHARLRMYPDGGIARFRLYGEVVPVVKETSDKVAIDFASVKTVVLLLNLVINILELQIIYYYLVVAMICLTVGRQKIQRAWSHRLGGYKIGCSSSITENCSRYCPFQRQFPQKVNVKGIKVDNESKIDPISDDWETIVDDSRTSADKEHEFDVKDKNKVYSHIKLTIIPDGGVKRIRAFGVRG